MQAAQSARGVMVTRARMSLGMLINGYKENFV